MRRMWTIGGFALRSGSCYLHLYSASGICLFVSNSHRCDTTATTTSTTLYSPNSGHGLSAVDTAVRLTKEDIFKHKIYIQNNEGELYVHALGYPRGGPRIGTL